MPCRSPGPHPGRRLRGSGQRGGSPGPHSGGKLRVWLGGGLQAHPGGEVEGSGQGGLQSPGPHPGGVLKVAEFPKLTLKHGIFNLDCKCIQDRCRVFVI